MATSHNVQDSADSQADHSDPPSSAILSEFLDQVVEPLLGSSNSSHDQSSNRTAVEKTGELYDPVQSPLEISNGRIQATELLLDASKHHSMSLNLTCVVDGEDRMAESSQRQSVRSHMYRYLRESN